MNEHQDPNEAPLLRATRDLTDKVDRLGNTLRVAQEQSRRTRTLVAITSVLAVLSLLGIAVTLYLYQEVRDAADQNQANAVINCENANEARAANQLLWDTVLSISAQSNGDRTPEEQERAEQFGEWVHALYEPRDCTDLSKRYDLPPPPTFTEESPE